MLQYLGSFVTRGWRGDDILHHKWGADKYKGYYYVSYVKGDEFIDYGFKWYKKCVIEGKSWLDD